MLLLFFVIIIVNITNGEDNSDNTYIESLPQNVKKVFLDKIARRILNEVPDVESGIKGVKLDEKYQEQSDFVEKILKEEINSLKSKRRHDLIRGNLEKSNILQNSNENDTKLSKDNGDKVEHIDLTLREGKSFVTKNVDINIKDKYSTNDSSAESVQFNNTETRIPVKVKYDKENEEKVKTRENQQTSNELLEKVGEIQKGYLGKKDKQTKIPRGNLKREITPHSEIQDFSKTSSNKYDSRRLDDTDYYTTPDTVDTPTEEIQSNITTDSTATAAQKTMMIEPENDTFVEVKKSTAFDNKENITLEANHYNHSNSNEYLGEEGSIENKTLKTVEKATTSTEFNIYTDNVPLASQNQSDITSNSSLLMTEASYINTGNVNEVSITEFFTNTNDEIKIKPDVIAIEEGSTSTKSSTSNTSLGIFNTTNGIGIDEVTVIPEIVDINILNTQTDVNSSDEVSTNPKTVDINVTYDIHTPKDVVITTDQAITRSIDTKKTESEDKIQNNISSNNKTSLDVKFGLKHLTKQYNNEESFGSLTQSYFGNKQVNKVGKEYKVFEIDLHKPAFVQENDDNSENREFIKKNDDSVKIEVVQAIVKDRIEEPQYYPVYTYGPRHAYFNAYNRLGPNIDEDENIVENKDVSDGVHVSETRETHHNIQLDYRTVLRSRPRKEKENIFDDHDDKYDHKKHKLCKMHDKHEKHFIPNTSEEDHPFQIHKKGLKNSLKGVRNVLYKNKIFGYVPSNQERSYFDATKDKKYNFTSRSRALEENTPEDAREDVSEDGSVYLSGHGHLRKIKEDPNQVSWDKKANKVTINGSSYDLNRLKPPYAHNEKQAILNVMNEIAYQFKWLNDYSKFKQASIERLYDLKPADYNKVRFYLTNLHRYNKAFNRIEIDKMVLTIDQLEHAKKKKPPKDFYKYLKQGERNSKHRYFRVTARGREMSIRHDVKGTFMHHTIMPVTPTFSFEVKPSNARQKLTEEEAFQNLDTLEVRSPKDMLANEETIRDSNISKDKDLDLYLEILKDLVKMDNDGLERYDWLGTTVDVRSALVKLIDLTQQKKYRQYIEPADSQLLGYTENLYRIANEEFMRREREAMEMHQEEDRIEEEATENPTGRSLPKNGNTIKRPLKVLDQIWLLMNADKPNERRGGETSFDFVRFLAALETYSKDFHEAIQQISRITTYKKQNWYKNIKELYLKSGGRKEYLEVLLHLYSTRVFSLIEESARNGANLDYKEYMKKNIIAVDKTTVEVLFLLRILKAIKSLD